MRAATVLETKRMRVVCVGRRPFAATSNEFCRPLGRGKDGALSSQYHCWLSKTVKPVSWRECTPLPTPTSRFITASSTEPRQPRRGYRWAIDC
jgi:hypothetical protein